MTKLADTKQEMLPGAGFDYVEDPVNTADGGTLIRARIQLAPAEGLDQQDARSRVEGALAKHRIQAKLINEDGPS